jgi:hypothetical protein
MDSSEVVVLLNRIAEKIERSRPVQMTNNFPDATNAQHVGKEIAWSLR